MAGNAGGMEALGMHGARGGDAQARCDFNAEDVRHQQIGAGGVAFFGDAQ